MWLINRIREKMIRKWIVLNVGITLFVIGLVGLTIKELACYQFNQYVHSTLRSEQFRQVLGQYLFDAGILALAIAVLAHLFFAKKILSPLQSLSRYSKTRDREASLSLNAFTRDEVGEIAGSLEKVSGELTDLNQKRNRMITDLAHELRTPLTNLNGYVEGLRSGAFDQNESVYAVLKEECGRLTTIVENMHELHRWENRKVELNCDWLLVEDLVHSNLSLFRNQLNKQEIQVRISVDPAQVYCDQRAVNALFTHLFDNVVRYDVGKKVVMEGNISDDRYIISVANRGKPIPEQEENHLFDPFYRAEKSRNRQTGGTGLGLAIVKEIVATFGGETGYDRKNGYHTFWFSIPVMKREP
ncbi:MAG TPA: HAMP domain-containing sensor histidine kinase [Bacillales bacterium]|nr:HAMP domain-containing sensor histidine kinase [Bacillales bacterium]